MDGNMRECWLTLTDTSEAMTGFLETTILDYCNTRPTTKRSTCENNMRVLRNRRSFSSDSLLLDWNSQAGLSGVLRRACFSFVIATLQRNQEWKLKMAVPFLRVVTLLFLYSGLCFARTLSGANKADSKVENHVEVTPLRHGLAELLFAEQEIRQDSNFDCGQDHLEPHTEDKPFPCGFSTLREDRPVLLSGMEAADKTKGYRKDHKEVPNLGRNLFRESKLEILQRLPRNTPTRHSCPNRGTSDGPGPL
ncbi:hypothetical protein MPTK1_3g09640 [Marchantia polymorpha subsp. ruderalis]|uniref:Uncharacterized protein n=2 Tax=Marchantia polymorpha TaxID=3197 RepID=A0AAF6AZ41_MARPO|nr:hypothetical protein MARPO_0085s0062 [Marchantia polymorpha]BBN05025.1 hypothetical protein Mp_3g09640 [Marchantia polymorpha subsp. ruderalis]|eukprot:PTQ33850.1 hypothetical protein MARPO_0085s0062 [Marchantia polymorpha]